MTGPEREKPSKDEDLAIGLNVGSGVGIGTGIGAVVFAITGEAFWIAIGTAFASARS